MKIDLSRNKKIGIYAGAVATALVSMVIPGANSVNAQIAPLNADIEINAQEIFLDENVESVVVEEKKAVDPAFIFEKLDMQMYSKENSDVYAEPKAGSDVQYTIEKGTEVTVLGKNTEGYLKILLIGEELYVKESDFTENFYEIFDECDLTMYSARNINVYEDVDLTNAISHLEQYEEVQVKGQNDSGLLKISHGDLEGYIKESDVIEFLPGQLHIEPGTHETTSLYIENMYDGVLAEIPDSEKTEENVEKLARLIHCEAGGQTEDGKLAVATVVVNRLFDGYWGDTVDSVIEAPGQFQPVSSGNYYSAVYSQEDYDCAYKVLVDGYRSFPAYVMYFQSIRLGYFGSNTYCICRDANGRWPQYFSYKNRDLDKYILE